MMYFAKNNTLITFDYKGKQSYAILNPLSGGFDLLESHEYQQISSGKPQKLDGQLADYMFERGYLFTDRTKEDELVNKQWELFQEEIANTQTQLLLIPSYGCNLACKYCYQSGVQAEPGLITPEGVEAFFKYAEAAFGSNRKKPFITLFGGEPLINSPRHRAIISLIIDRCVELGYEVAAVTNGYDLVDYVDLLARASVKEIQVTLDGSQAVHDQRRGTVNGKGTFDRIILGIEAALQRGITINLRSVIDQENLEDLVDYARFLDEKGWLDLAPQLFKTQLGRNYELFDCYAKPQYLLAEAELWRKVWQLSLKYPILNKFHRPEFKGIRHLVDTGEMYMASFDTCPAAKTEWVFDLDGDIYGCTASCGREEYKLGTFYPEAVLFDEKVQQWQMRNVNNIKECHDCRYNVICGGGCGVVAANRTGRVLAPDCRPIQELLEIGVNYYAEEVMALADSEEPPSASEIKPENVTGFVSGCTVCGEELVYQDRKQLMQCAICGIKEQSLVSCKNGHYVCNDCHSKNILDRTYDFCMDTNLEDPLAVLIGLFQLPGLHMHGPEYHSIVAAAMVTAYANRVGLNKKPAVKEAIARGQDVKGGSCGHQGVCGAAAGAGIAYSIINDVSPMSREKRGAAMRLTATILNEMSQYGGPRCCKRESALAVETAVKIMDEFDGEHQSHYKCIQYMNNPDCIKQECPYFPSGKAKREGK